MRIFTADAPEGIDGKDDWIALDPDFHADVRSQLAIHGVARLPCWCCGHRVVIRPDGFSANHLDRAYLAEYLPDVDLSTFEATP